MAVPDIADSWYQFDQTGGTTSGYYSIQKPSGKWGNNGERLYNAWAKDHQKEIDAFVLELDRKAEAATRRMRAKIAGKFKE